MRPLTSLGAGAVAAAAILSGACGSPLGPPTATTSNVIDTVTLYALTGTPVGSPSAFDIEDNVRVRTDTSPAFDFVFDIAGGHPALYPPGAFPGIPRSAALQYAATFAGVTSAPTSGWNDSTALSIDSGSVILVRSRVVTCVTYAATVFEYAKLQVLAIDTVARTMSMEILANTNCGYRDLTVGLPQQ